MSDYRPIPAMGWEKLVFRYKKVCFLACMWAQAGVGFENTSHQSVCWLQGISYSELKESKDTQEGSNWELADSGFGFSLQTEWDQNLQIMDLCGKRKEKVSGQHQVQHKAKWYTPSSSPSLIPGLRWIVHFALVFIVPLHCKNKQTNKKQPCHKSCITSAKVSRLTQKINLVSLIKLNSIYTLSPSLNRNIHTHTKVN